MLLRHARKEYKNNKNPKDKPRHDPPIVDGLEIEIKTKISNIFREHGKPDIVIVSPFLRTRQTYIAFKEMLDNETKIIIDKNVEEYLGFQRPYGKIADLDGETYKYTFPKLGKEKLTMLDNRSKEFLKKYKDSDKKILVITHGIFINYVSKNLNFPLSRISELEGIVYKKNLTQKA